jgi:serine/threonine protein kinase/Tol biopolymer transport system component
VTGGTVSHYDIVEVLERGETAVYKARDLRDGALVALEVLPATRYTRGAMGGGTAETEERFRRESEIAAGLDHPHICPALDAGETCDGGFFVARSLDHGETLRSRIERGPLAPEQAVGLASQIAAALGRAHEKGIVHRDLRPANVLVAPGGQVRVSGFGLFWLLPQDGSCPASIAAFRSPELLSQDAPAHAADAADTADARADIWSLGVLLHQMVTGRHPFRGGDRSALETAIRERDPEPMTTVNPGLPPELQEIVARALSKDPAGRPARMDDLLVVLRGLLAGSGLTAVDSTVVQVPGVLRAPFPNTVSPGGPGGPGGGPSSLAPAREAPDDHMKGSTVSQYRILGLLGGGSMGTVYQAEDTRLRRTVALKFLPAELSRDPMAKARFFQEAQAASALDHPNICTIHEVGETGDGHLYLAMASYDGETVRSRLARGPLSVAEAVEIARQTALGLAKAHRNGIVHRDIKPANLIVTIDGVVKILDFGVAKLRGPGVVNVAGSFLGTPAYMSPEQARGEEVDPRADVWSLGVVLYEMLAGVRPFKGGDDLTAVLRSLLEDRPEPLSRLRPDDLHPVPPELERIVARMLARSPAERYPSAAEAGADLAAFQAPPAVRRHRFLGAAMIALAASAAVLLGLGGYLILRQPSAPPETVLPQPVFSRLTDEEGRELYPSLSPDGRTFVYAKAVDGQLDLFLQRIEDGSTPMNLTEGSPHDDTQPSISPDGGRIAFRSERDGGGVFVMPLGGGPARRVSEVGQNPAWSPDGRELAVATEAIVDPGMRKSESEIWILDTVSGLRREIPVDDGVQPSWSPHGWRLAYWGVPAGSARRILWTVSAEGGKPSKLLDDGASNWNPVWSPDGAWLYFGSDRSGSLNLWRLPIDERTGEAQGKPEPVTTPAMASGFWSLSRDGRRMIYAANESRSNVESFPFDPVHLRVTGPGTAVTRGSNLVRSCSVSPDGTRIAFHAALPREDLFVVGADGSGQRQLTDDAAKDRQPFWSPDGSRLLFYSNRGGRYEAWLLSLLPGGPRGSTGRVERVERVLPEGRGEPASFPVWSPDGRRVACTLESGPAMIDLAEPLTTRRPEPFASASSLGESFYPTSWSGDGERIAGNISRLDRSIPEGIGVYLVPSRTYERWTSRGRNPVWLHDSGRLLYTEGDNILAFDPRTHKARQVLEPPSSSAYLSMSTGPGDRSLFVVRAVDEGDIWLLTRGGEK